MNKVLPTIFVLVSLSLAGCLQTGIDGNSASNESGAFPSERFVIPEDPMPEGDGHDHTNVDAHKFLWNFDKPVRDPLQGNQAMASGLHALDIQAGYLFGAVYGANAASMNGGIQIWDLADPANPAPRGALSLSGFVGGDRSMGATADGNMVVLSAEMVDCLGHVNPIPVVAYLIDTSDKDAPVILDTLTSAGPSQGSPDRVSDSLGKHSVTVQRIGDADYAFIHGEIFDITSRLLVDTGFSVRTGHDLFIRETPTGAFWALAANGNGGLQVYDVSDITDIQLIANWDLDDREAGDSYYFHTADVAFFDDQVVMIVTSEDWENHVSPFWILDATMLRDHPVGSEPVVLDHIGTWSNPGGHVAGQPPLGPNNLDPDADPQSNGMAFSLHNPRFHENGLMTLSSYHGGMWQFDFRNTAFRADPNVIGFGVYAEGIPPLTEDPVADVAERALCGLGSHVDTPSYMDVEMDEASGVVYVADLYMGLYAFAPSEDHVFYGDV